jgi:thymidylate synthase ThyX
MNRPYPFVSAEVVCDSLHPDLDIRLTTLQVKCPRFIWSEVMTHRVFSRNAQSSRACPVATMIERVKKNPVMPIEFGSNQPGMQAGEPLTGAALTRAEDVWKDAAWMAAEYADKLINLGVHKQVANRILEPYVQISAVITSTEWDNFFKLRIHPDAQPEIHALAKAMKQAMDESTPDKLGYREWHLPYIRKEEINHPYNDLRRWSAARCARVSFDNHDGTEVNPDKDNTLSHRLIGASPRHWSPFEHQATPMKTDHMFANFRGFKSSRSQLEWELEMGL